MLGSAGPTKGAGAAQRQPQRDNRNLRHFSQQGVLSLRNFYRLTRLCIRICQLNVQGHEHMIGQN
jgi:hypothetical protein